MNKVISRAAVIPSLLLLASATLVGCAGGGTKGSVEYATSTDADGVSRTQTVTSVANPDAPIIEQRIVGDGAKLMNGAQATAYLSGNTQQWANGGALYKPNGMVHFIWENKEFTDHKWYAQGNGLVCIQNGEGFTTSCSKYFNYKGEVWTIVTEVFGERQEAFGGPDTLMQGDKLSELEPWDPALSGN